MAATPHPPRSAWSWPTSVARSSKASTLRAMTTCVARCQRRSACTASLAHTSDPGRPRSSDPSRGSTGTSCCSRTSAPKRCRLGHQRRRAGPRAPLRHSTRARTVAHYRAGCPGPSITNSRSCGAACLRAASSPRPRVSPAGAPMRRASGSTSRYRSCARTPDG